jgi:hypothetical protein
MRRRRAHACGDDAPLQRGNAAAERRQRERIMRRGRGRPPQSDCSVIIVWPGVGKLSWSHVGEGDRGPQQGEGDAPRHLYRKSVLARTKMIDGSDSSHRVEEWWSSSSSHQEEEEVKNASSDSSESSLSVSHHQSNGGDPDHTCHNPKRRHAQNRVTPTSTRHENILGGFSKLMKPW